jgi:hypothetical protein
MTKLTTHAIAAIVHDLNKSYCQQLGDFSQPVWEDTPLWQRNSAVAGVEFHKTNPDAGDAASHNSWMREKVNDGWVYGEVKDPEAKTHPCMVQFELLPLEQQIKDRLFRQTVHTLLALT